MIKYFKFKKRPNGNRQLYIKEKKDIFDKNPKEIYISKKGSLVIYGIEASGKSQKLKTIIAMADELWRNETKIIFKATDSLSEILFKNLDGDDETKELLFEEQEDMESLDMQRTLGAVKKQYVKFEALIEKAKNSILIIDDIDKITGKKLELTKDLLRNCKRYIITAKGEDSINRTLRNIMFKRKMKISTVQLTSSASVDATNILFAIFILGLFVGGLPEMAMLVMAGRMVTKGTS
jgi:hypothetical protein